MTTQLDRRRFLSMGLVAAGAALVGGSAFPTVMAQSAVAGAPRWSDPATWGGKVPSAGQKVTLDQPVVLDIDVQVAGLSIQAGGALIFDPNRSCTLTSTGNLVVMGLLQMRPSSSAVNHLIRFSGIDESRFVGGGHMVLDTDVGLWCLHDGIVDVAGTERRAWARTTSGVAPGATSITLQVEAVGWRVGDQIAIVPTVGTEHANHHDAYDYALVTSVSGSTVGLSAPTRFAHPVSDVGNGIVVAPEVLNLTRNVNIEGTASGRAHIMFVHSSKPQQMSYFGARWMGPRQATGEKDFTASVLGRYGLHFHMVGDAARGSNIIGGVVRDAGGHAYVPHESHGMTFTSCISHDTFDDAYWWDGAPDTRTPGSSTHDVVYETCVASRVKCAPDFRGYQLAGFTLGAGEGNDTRDCVAVGVQGNRNASGFHWPEGSISMWDFRRNISHNNKCSGIFTWQNTGNPHVVEDFICYHNGISGVNHGAYLASYVYRNGYLFRNGVSAFDLHSNSHSQEPQRLESLHCVSGPNNAYGVRVLKHRLEPGRPTEIIACTFVGQAKAAIGMAYDGHDGATTRELFDIVNCESSSPLLWLRDDTVTSSVVRVQAPNTTVVATPRGTQGTSRPEWNAMVRTIQPFFTGSADKRATLIGVVGGGHLGKSSSPSTPATTTSVAAATTTTSSTTATSTPTPITTPTTAAPTPTTTTTTTTTTTATSPTTTYAPAVRKGGKSTGKGGRKPRR